VAWRLANPVGGMPVAQEAPPVPAVVQASSTSQPAEESADAVEPPQVEINMDGEDVRIYRFASDEDENTAMWFIVNPAMELSTTMQKSFILAARCSSFGSRLI